MSKKLLILNLEDNPNDTELIQAKLEEEGLACEITRVETERDFVAAVERKGFDIILADYELPSFDGLSALAIAKEKCPDIPFILISGAIGEELAIDSMKRGADDYILKDRIFRLASAVRRVLKEAEERIERRKAEEKIRESEQFIRNILDTVDEGFIVIDRDYRILTANKAYCRQVGGSEERIVGSHCYEISHKTNRPCFEEGEDCSSRRVFDTGEPHVALHRHEDAKGSIL